MGVCIVGRPVGGSHQYDWLEVTRLCTDGSPNACSFLYGAAVRAGKALGYARIQTYILEEETGVSLKASGWKFERMSHPTGRHRKGPNGPADESKVAEHLRGLKQLWYRPLVDELLL